MEGRALRYRQMVISAASVMIFPTRMPSIGPKWTTTHQTRRCDGALRRFSITLQKLHPIGSHKAIGLPRQ